jgi:hypothetical protein
MVSGKCLYCQENGNHRIYFRLESHYARSPQHRPLPNICGNNPNMFNGPPMIIEPNILLAPVDILDAPGDIVPPDGLQHIDDHMDYEDDVGDYDHNVDNEYHGFDAFNVEENDFPPIVLRHNGPIPHYIREYHLENSECRQSISTL